MITFSESSKAPKIFNEKALGASWVGIDALKDVHVSFNGYGIADGETLHFPTAEMLQKSPKSFIKVMATTAGSKNKSALVRVIRENNGVTRDSWVNMSMFSRMANTEDGERMFIDEARELLAPMNDDSERLTYLLGKKVTCTGEIEAFGPKFDRDTRQLVRDEEGKVVYIPAKYKTISIEENAEE